jgi:hypothetical protein
LFNVSYVCPEPVLVKTPEVLVKNGFATFRQKREGFFRTAVTAFAMSQVALPKKGLEVLQAMLCKQENSTLF